jgi:hypothetical protein
MKASRASYGRSETEFQKRTPILLCMGLFRDFVSGASRCAAKLHLRAAPVSGTPWVMTIIQPWLNCPQRHNMDAFLAWACRRRLQEGSSHG